MIDLKELDGIFNGGRIIELSHVLEEGIPVWETHPKFKHNEWESPERGDVARSYQLVVHEHNGTHIDMPLHFVHTGAPGLGADSQSAQRFIGPCVTLDFSGIGTDGLVSAQDVKSWEKAHGEINPGDIVLMNLGWGGYWGTDNAKFCSNWPGVAEDAAVYLAGKKIKMLGVDTMAVDAYISKTNPVHKVLLPGDILIIENLANLEQMPVRGYFIALPLRIKDGSGSPVRAIGLAG